MAAQTTPEIIVPGNLYIPDGKVGYSIQAAAMPNGDDTFRVTNTAGANEFFAHTDAHADHLMGTGECSLSFWIRRNQNFAGSSFTLSAFQSTTVDTSDKLIMGVVDPTTNANFGPGDNKMGWGLFSYSSSGIQLLVQGVYNGNASWWQAINFTLAIDTWHYLVINRSAATLTGPSVTLGQQGEFVLYQDGVLVSTLTNALWTYVPGGTAGKRFALGDGTARGLTEIGASAGAAWDISHLAFHNKQLTVADQLEMIESMKYGPAS